MNGQLIKNFEYDHWATAEMIQALEGMEIPPPRAVQILGHIAFAKDVWLTRWLGEDTARLSDPWPPYALPEAKEILEKLHERWRAVLEGLASQDLEKTIAFTNTQGKVLEQTLLDVLVQVVDHGTYHRGQLATLIHQGGGKRPNAGYIAYVRGLSGSK